MSHVLRGNTLVNLFSESIFEMIDLATRELDSFYFLVPGLNYSPTVLPLQSYHSYQDPPSISTPNSRRLIRDDGSRPNFTDTLPTSLLSHSYIHPVDSVSSAASRSIVMGYEEGSTNAVQVGAPVRDRQYYHEAMELLSQSGSSLVNGGAPNRPVFPA